MNKSIHTLLGSAVLLILTTMSTNGQDTPENGPHADLLKELAKQQQLADAQKNLAASQAAKLKSEQELAKQQLAPQEAATAAEAAADAKREKELTEALAKLTEAAAKLPTGAVTATTGLVATPVSTALALKATEDLAGKVAAKIAAAAGPGQTLVFVDKLPAPTDTLQFQVWLEAAHHLERRLTSLQARVATVKLASPAPSGAVTPKSLTTAVVIAAALPGAINAIAGLFRADYTEKVGETALDGAGFQAFVMERLSGAGGRSFYPSLDALAWSRLVSPSRLSVGKQLTQLEISQGTLTEASAQIAALVAAKQAKVTAYQAGISARSGRIAALQSRIDEAREKIALAGQDEANQRLATLLENRVETLKTELTAFEKTVDADALRHEIDAFTEDARAIAPVLADLTVLVTETLKVGTDGRSRLLTLMREELIHQTAWPSDFAASANGGEFPAETSPVAHRAAGANVLFVTLTVTQKPQSVVEKKTIWSRSFHATALLAVEYRLARADGRIVAAGVEWRGYAQKMPLPTKLAEILSTGN